MNNESNIRVNRIVRLYPNDGAIKKLNYYFKIYQDSYNECINIYHNNLSYDVSEISNVIMSKNDISDDKFKLSIINQAISSACKNILMYNNMSNKIFTLRYILDHDLVKSLSLVDDSIVIKKNKLSFKDWTFVQDPFTIDTHTNLFSDRYDINGIKFYDIHIDIDTVSNLYTLYVSYDIPNVDIIGIDIGETNSIALNTGEVYSIKYELDMYYQQILSNTLKMYSDVVDGLGTLETIFNDNRVDDLFIKKLTLRQNKENINILDIIYKDLKMLKKNFMTEIYDLLESRKPKFAVIESFTKPKEYNISNQYDLLYKDTDKNWFFYNLTQIIQKSCKANNIILYIADKSYPSTRRCPKCGTINTSIGSSKYFKCKNKQCDYQMDRDIHAAINLTLLVYDETLDKYIKKMLVPDFNLEYRYIL